MKTSVISVCIVAVLFWAGTTAWAQGKGQSKGGTANKTQDNSSVTADTPSSQDQPAKPEQADKAGKATKEADQGGPARGQKQGGSQGKKGQQPAEAPAKGKGKGGQQQLQAFEKQLQHEQAKHMERQARLTRIRELAVQKGDAETVARVDKLIAKEQEVFGRKLQQMQGQRRATQQPGAGVEQGTTPPTDVSKPQGEAGADKPKGTPAGDANEVSQEQKKAEQEKAKTGADAGGRTKRQRTKERQGDPNK